MGGDAGTGWVSAVTADAGNAVSCALPDRAPHPKAHDMSLHPLGLLALPLALALPWSAASEPQKTMKQVMKLLEDADPEVLARYQELLESMED